MSDQILTACIGAASALLVVIIKDLILSFLSNRRKLRRELVELRLKNAYTPLVYMIRALEASHSQKDKIRTNMQEIMKEFGHLLSGSSYGAIQLLIYDIEETETIVPNGVMKLIDDYESLIKSYYRSHHSKDPFTPK